MCGRAHASVACSDIRCNAGRGVIRAQWSFPLAPSRSPAPDNPLGTCNSTRAPGSQRRRWRLAPPAAGVRRAAREVPQNENKAKRFSLLAVRGVCSSRSYRAARGSASPAVPARRAVAFVTLASPLRRIPASLRDFPAEQSFSAARWLTHKDATPHQPPSGLQVVRRASAWLLLLVVLAMAVVG